jgi:membrane protease YdiL (CAAX protease family)
MMDVLGPRMRRGVARVVPGNAGGRMPLLPAATRRPAAVWRVRDALLILGAGLLFLIAALIVSLGLAQLQDVDAQSTAPRALISTLVSAAFYLFLFWMIQLLILRRYRVDWRALGLRTTNWQWLAAMPLVNAMLIFSDVLFLRALVAVLGPSRTWPRQLSQSTLDATQQPALLALVVLTGLVLTPVIEELLFRGVLYQALRRRMSIGSAALISAFIFALMHGQIVLLIPFTIMGVVLALIYERSGSLWPTILVHACNNGIILLFAAGSLPH